jgi:hypothetical protein
MVVRSTTIRRRQALVAFRQVQAIHQGSPRPSPPLPGQPMRSLPAHRMARSNELGARDGGSKRSLDQDGKVKGPPPVGHM